MSGWPKGTRSARGRGSARHKRSAGVHLAVGLCGIALVISASARRTAPVLLFNPSTSAPRGWYLLGPDVPTRVGQFALVRLPEAAAQLADRRHYLPIGTNLLKAVAALYGDYVCADGATVRINRRLVGRPLAVDTEHRPLSAWRGCEWLRDGQYFVLSQTNPASFDSRYFGPVDRERVIGRAVPLWTWP